MQETQKEKQNYKKKRREKKRLLEVGIEGVKGLNL